MNFKDVVEKLIANNIYFKVAVDYDSVGGVLKTDYDAKLVLGDNTEIKKPQKLLTSWLESFCIELIKLKGYKKLNVIVDVESSTVTISDSKTNHLLFIGELRYTNRLYFGSTNHSVFKKITYRNNSGNIVKLNDISKLVDKLINKDTLVTLSNEGVINDDIPKRDTPVVSYISALIQENNNSNMSLVYNKRTKHLEVVIFNNGNLGEYTLNKLVSKHTIIQKNIELQAIYLHKVISKYLKNLNSDTTVEVKFNKGYDHTIVSVIDNIGRVQILNHLVESLDSKVDESTSNTLVMSKRSIYRSGEENNYVSNNSKHDILVVATYMSPSYKECIKLGKTLLTNSVPYSFDGLNTFTVLSSLNQAANLHKKLIKKGLVAGLLNVTIKEIN